MILQHPLIPKNSDGILRVFIPGRISTPAQDMEAITTTQENMEAWLRQAHPGPTAVTRVGEQASGWLVNRKSMVKVAAAIQAGECDLILVRELREIYRNPRLSWGFIQDCVDRDVRVICVWDNIDTADENWEIPAHIAVLRSGLAVPEARMRVKGKATHTFNQGGMVLKVKYGYRKLTKEEAASGTFGTQGLRITKLPECTVNIQEMRRRILVGTSREQVADGLNEEGIVPGLYVNSGKWTGRLVFDLLTDPILSGQRRFRKELSRFIYGTGTHKAQSNPSPMVEECPELAHMTPAEQQELIDYFAAHSPKNKEAQKSGRESPLWDVPRSRSLWPGQAARCAACNGLMYRYGEVLKCQNAVPGGSRTCWNHVLVPIEMVHKRVIPEVIRFLDRDNSAKSSIVAVAWHSYQVAIRQRERSGGDLSGEIAELKEQEKNLAYAIATNKNGEIESLTALLVQVQTRRKTAMDEDERLKSRTQAVGTFRSAADIEARFADAVAGMAAGSRDFADVLRRLIPRFVIQPVQALDVPQVRPRAVLTLSTAAWVRPGEAVLEETVTLDLFEAPDHITCIPKCMLAKQTRPQASLRKIAVEVGVGYMTVKRASAYARLMLEKGVTDAYQVLSAPPKKASRWRPLPGQDSPPATP